MESVEGEHVRLFIAIPVPEAIRAKLGGTQAELRQLIPRHSASWAQLGSLHLTLRFFGNVAVLQIPVIASRLRGALAGFGTLHLHCSGMGLFPDRGSPRVLWAGVTDTAKRLHELHDQIDQSIGAFAEKPAESQFVGHVTLARLRPMASSGTARLIRFVEQASEREYGSWSEDRVALFQSELRSAGAVHSELAAIELS